MGVLHRLSGLIAVSSTPTHAAMHPGWPETLISIVISFYAVIVALFSDGDYSQLTFFTLLLPGIVDVAWTTAFAFIEHDKATGGWLSVIDGSTSCILMLWAQQTGNPGIGGILALFWVFQTGAEIAVLVQRWKGYVGTIAYMINDSNGCTPYNGFQYLEQGARSRAFRIIQTAEYLYSGLVITGVYLAGASGEVGNSHMKLKAGAGLGLLVMYIPVIIYESIIAVKGKPVVISGNCMLVELDPRFGFLDSEIQVWWKFLVGLAGM